jgi:hypothetical protein
MAFGATALRLFLAAAVVCVRAQVGLQLVEEVKATLDGKSDATLHDRMAAWVEDRISQFQHSRRKIKTEILEKTQCDAAEILEMEFGVKAKTRSEVGLQLVEEVKATLDGKSDATLHTAPIGLATLFSVLLVDGSSFHQICKKAEEQRSNR